MRNASISGGLLGLSDAVVEDVEFDLEAGRIVAHVRVRKGTALLAVPGQVPCYDRGQGRRRWRHLHAGVLQVLLEAHAPRVNCRACGVNVAHVPWARADARHTVDFDRQVAWSATRMSKSAVVELMRVAWRIVERYWADVEDCFDRFENLTRIGIDEISYSSACATGVVAINARTAGRKSRSSSRAAVPRTRATNPLETVKPAAH